MNQTARFMFGVLICLAIVMTPGCEDKWEDPGEGFNTSQGAGINVNFSGVYTPRNGTVIIPTGPDGEDEITRLIVTQIGNTLEVRNDFGQLYTGYIGAPGVMSSGGSYPSGATMLQAQIAFSNGKNVDFVGVIRAIAVTDVTTSQTSTQTSTGQTQGTDTSTDGTRSTNITVDVVEISGAETVTVNIESDDSTTTGATGTTTDSTTSSSSSGRTYNVTEANTLYVMEGNWIRHQFDDVIFVEAKAPAMRGSF